MTDTERLLHRIEQLSRFRQLHAPEAIVLKQEGMVMQALGMLLRDKDPDTFALPTYAEATERLDTQMKLYQHGKLLAACRTALPYLAHLKESYEEGAPELEDWNILTGAITMVTGEEPG